MAEAGGALLASTLVASASRKSGVMIGIGILYLNFPTTRDPVFQSFMNCGLRWMIQRTNLPNLGMMND